MKLTLEEKYLDEIFKMTNEEVLEEYSRLVCGDDYEGCYTELGEWQYEQIKPLFFHRLKKCGYLK